MDINNEKLISWLFGTKALKVCEHNNPFWYTSGTIGPYYINTHFLFGSEEKAKNLLELIDYNKFDRLLCPHKVRETVLRNYDEDNIYKELIDHMCKFIEKNINLSEVDYISGGERRDWFFSMMVSYKLNKPHITIYKDKTIVYGDDEYIFAESGEFSNKNILHIADLITEASSYRRTWIPAIEEKGGILKWSVVVVDRKQGGEKVLSEKNIQLFSMINVDKGLFQKAMELGYIGSEQHEMIRHYLQNPKKSMTNFLRNNPQFLEKALNSDDKTKERAELCIENKIYDLKYNS